MPSQMSIPEGYRGEGKMLERARIKLVIYELRDIYLGRDEQQVLETLLERIDNGA